MAENRSWIARFLVWHYEQPIWRRVLTSPVAEILLARLTWYHRRIVHVGTAAILIALMIGKQSGLADITWTTVLLGGTFLYWLPIIIAVLTAPLNTLQSSPESPSGRD